MPNIRIKDIPTTASATSSTDFIGIDGSANGTRKLDAYNPTFGGNLTVNGTSALNGTVNTNGAKAVNVTPTVTPLSGNLYGLYVQPTINSGASAGGTVSGLTVAATNSGTSNVTNIAGIEFIGGNGAASGSMQDLKAFRSSPVNLSTGQIVNLYQFYATNAYNPSGTINTQYGLYVDALTSATTNYAIYTAGTAPSVLGGNLTVSGTGTSTFSGDIKIQKANAQLEIRSASDAAGQFQYLTFGSPNYNRAQFRSNNQGVADGAISLYTFDAGIPVIAQYWTKSGNSLLGTTTDSGNGKLQLATHTSSAGGIGFGTDVSLYRQSTTDFALVRSTNNPLYFYSDSANQGIFTNATAVGSGFYVTPATNRFTIRTANIDAVYFDATQRGVFTGDIVLNKTGTDPFLYSGGGRGLMIGTNAGVLALTLDSSQNATFAGTGTSSFAGNLNIKGALGAHQTATLNLAYEGSSVSQLVAYGADASTLGRVNVILRKAGTGTDAVTGLSVRDFGIITQGGVAQTPASASATGTAGTIQWDASYIYVCTATNTWKRVAIATWP